MAKIPARISDPVNNSSHGNGSIVQVAATTVTFEGQPVACAGDQAEFSDGTKGAIIQGNACVEVNGKRVALVDDQTENGGVINAGASSIQIDEGDSFVFIGDNVEIGENVIFSSEPMQFYNQHFQLFSSSTGEPLANVFYRMSTPQGIIEGMTNQQGKTMLAFNQSADEISMEILGTVESSSEPVCCE